MTRAKMLGAAAALAAAFLVTVALAATGTAGTGGVGTAAPIGRSLVIISKALGERDRATATPPDATDTVPTTTAAQPATPVTAVAPGPPITATTAANSAAVGALPPKAAPGDPAQFPELEWGAGGESVTVLQKRLVELGFMRAETVDGYFGYSTWSAVLAFQKFEGLERHAWVDKGTWQRLYQPQGHLPEPRPLHAPGQVEVDLERQLLFAYNVDRPGSLVILNASSGGNYWYINPESKQEELAYTPTGDFAVYRRVDGLEEAPLGELYRPLYFTGGWAVHGSTDVPSYPASHGCVRLSYPDMDWLYDRAAENMPVRVVETTNPETLFRQKLRAEAAPYLAAAEGMVSNLAAA